LKSASDSDGGALTWSPTVTGQTDPIRFFSNSFEYLFWIQYTAASDLGEVHASLGSSTVYIPIAAENGLKLLAPDPSGTYIVAGVAPISGVGGKIYRTTYSNSGAVTAALTGIPNMTGLAADSTYYYWTQNDGRVYRHLK
jgi:hypothetical protein